MRRPLEVVCHRVLRQGNSNEGEYPQEQRGVDVKSECLEEQTRVDSKSVCPQKQRRMDPERERERK